MQSPCPSSPHPHSPFITWWSIPNNLSRGQQVLLWSLTPWGQVHGLFICKNLGGSPLASAHQPFQKLSMYWEKRDLSKRRPPNQPQESQWESLSFTQMGAGKQAAENRKEDHLGKTGSGSKVSSSRTDWGQPAGRSVEDQREKVLLFPDSEAGPELCTLESLSDPWPDCSKRGKEKRRGDGTKKTMEEL